ncbi:MAG: transposase, partial [Chloroflexota bacterium]
RRDFHYKLAHALCKVYDHFYFEDLTLDGMKRMWGRKVSDLGFAKFLTILERVAIKLGKTVTKIDPFTPTSQTCSQCGHRQKISLNERVFDCQQCNLELDRDHNAARNILRTGSSVPTERGLRKSSASV